MPHEVPDKMLVHTLELLFQRIGLLPSRFFDLSRNKVLEKMAAQQRI